jgi:hypothetical protein
VPLCTILPIHEVALELPRGHVVPPAVKPQPLTVEVLQRLPIVYVATLPRVTGLGPVRVGVLLHAPWACNGVQHQGVIRRAKIRARRDHLNFIDSPSAASISLPRS